MTFPVVLDACVLVPHPLFDTLLRIAETGLYRPLWSAEILAEVERTLLLKRALAPRKVERRMRGMQRAFPGAIVDGYAHLIPSMTNDEKDRHVLAAAVRSGVSLIVTANLKDFPRRAMEPYDIEAIHPDAFLLDQLDLDPDGVLDCLRQQRADYTDPVLSAAEFYQAFMATVPEFAQAAESLERGPMRDVLVGENRPWPGELPLPLEARSDAAAFGAFFPLGEPDPTTPLGAAFMWWTALRDIEDYLVALENLTCHPPAWARFAEAREELRGWAMAQFVEKNDERPDLVAYVKFIPSPGTSAKAFADANVYDAQILTLVRCDDGWWRVWGLSRNRRPPLAEVVGA